jgi:hypothetical protein
LVEAGANGVINDFIANYGNETTKNTWVDNNFQVDGLARHFC